MSTADVIVAHDQSAVEVFRGANGRLELVLSRSSTVGGVSHALHARLRPAARTFGRRFRESDALRLMGFSPKAGCRFFPMLCSVGGCYSRDLSDVAVAQIAESDDWFNRVLMELPGVVERLVDAAVAAEELDLPLR